MANIGRILIMPKGNYDASVSYEILDMVNHGGSTWVAKKNAIGIEPSDAHSEYWFKMVNNSDVENIINGTTPVGDANKLGGKDASEYALGTDLVRFKGTEWLGESILEKALNIEDGVTNYTLGGQYYTANDLPNGNYLYSMATIFKRSSADISVVVWGYGNFLPIINNYSNGAWGGWNTLATTADLANYLPLSGGGTVESTSLGIIELKRKDALGSAVKFSNTKCDLGGIGFSTEGKPTYYEADVTKSHQILHSGNVGDYALPKSGGTATGLTITGGNGQAYVTYSTGGTRMGYLGFIGANNPVLIKNDDATVCSLLHTGNSAKVAIQSTAPSDTSALWVW